MKFVLVVDGHIGEFGIASLKQPTCGGPLQTFHGQFAVNFGYDDVPILGCDATIDHQLVIVGDAGVARMSAELRREVRFVASRYT